MLRLRQASRVQSAAATRRRQCSSAVLKVAESNRSTMASPSAPLRLGPTVTSTRVVALRHCMHHSTGPKLPRNRLLSQSPTRREFHHVYNRSRFASGRPQQQQRHINILHSRAGTTGYPSTTAKVGPIPPAWAPHQVPVASMSAATLPQLEAALASILGSSVGSLDDAQWRRIRDETANETDAGGDGDAADALLLACSPLSQPHDLTCGGSSAWRRRVLRVVRSLRAWTLAAWDAALLVLRGAEIGARLSPLAVLAPLALAASSVERRLFGEGHRGIYGPMLEDAAWSYLLSALQGLGPTFVKLAQWASTRRDMFSPTVCDRLGTLQSYNRVHGWGHTDRVLREAFGADYGTRLRVGRDDVIGSGCVAQVYRGELLPPALDPSLDDGGGGDGEERGKPVAIKVLHPSIASSIDRDVTFMRRAACLLDSLPFDVVKCLSLPRVVDNFEDIMHRQVDLRIEGENLRRFQSNFITADGVNGGESNKTSASSARNGVTVSFPSPVHGWVSRNVLVEELIEGIMIKDVVESDLVAANNATTNDAAKEIDEMAAIPVSSTTETTTVSPISVYLADTSEEGMETRRKLARPLLVAFLQMVFGDNFVHCDLHPGNVLVKTTTTFSSTSRSHRDPSFGFFFPPRNLLMRRTTAKIETKTEQHHTIIFLDAGITTSLSPQGEQNLKDLFRAVVLNDGETAGRLMVERAQNEKCSQVEGGVDAFAKGMSGIVSEFHDNRKQGLTLGAVRIGSLLGRVLDLCRVHGVEIDPSMASIVISTLVLEGLGRSLEPDLNLFDFVVPYLLKTRSRN